jgi:hypothetical protein
VQQVLELFQVLYFMTGFILQFGGIGPLSGHGGVGGFPLLAVI